MDERKQTGASLARTPAEAKRKVDMAEPEEGEGEGALRKGRQDHEMSEDDYDTGMGHGVAGTASSPRAARRMQMPEAMEHVSKEHDDPISHPEVGGLNASMERAPAGSKRAQAEFMKKSHAEELGERGKYTNRQGVYRKPVEADHVIGEGGSHEMRTAEAIPEMTGSKAQRKEAGEPEREEDEMAAMGAKEDEQPRAAHKNTMGWGERETVAKHTI